MTEAVDRTDERDDAIWFDALTGRLPETAEPSNAAEEGRYLRDVLCALDKEEVASEKLEADWERLRFRLRKEGLVGRRVRPSLAYWALAASLFMAVSVTWFYSRSPTELPESEIVRGGQATTVVLRVANPAAAAERLVQVCQQAGITARRRDNADGVPMLDLDIPVRPPAALQEVFKHYEAELPAPGKVTLVLMRLP